MKEQESLAYQPTRIILLKNPTPWWAQKATICPACDGPIIIGRKCLGPGLAGLNAWIHSDHKCLYRVYRHVRDIPGYEKLVSVDIFDLLCADVRFREYKGVKI